MCQFVTLENELFVFIDTPGFGTGGYSASQVSSVIQNTLGFATRYFGGVHGILYVHNVETDREYKGITESLDFFRKLKREGRLPTLTFVATKWDCVRDEERKIYEDRITDLGNTTWGEFIGHGYIEFGCDYNDSNPETRQAVRAALVEQLVRRYGRVVDVSMEMPTWEWTWGEIGTGIAMVTNVTGGAANVARGAFAVAGGTLAASSTFTAAGMGYGLFLAAPILFPLTIAGIAMGVLRPESRNGRLGIGIDTTGV